MKLIRKSSLLILFLFIGLNAFAQPDPDLPSEEVNIEKQFDAVLREANKKPTSPSLPPVDTSSAKNQQYLLPPRLLELDYEAPTIRPLAMRRAAKEKVYNFYSKAGLGLPFSLYGEAVYNSGSSERFNFRIGGKHHSMNNNGSFENQRYSHNNLGIGGTYFSDKGFAIDGDLGLRIDQEHFYGYNNADTTIAKDQVLQRFTEVDGEFKFFNSLPTQGGINYNAGLNFFSIGDHFQAQEFGVGGTIGFDKWINNKHLIAIQITDHIFNFNDTITQTNNLFELEPSLSTNFGVVKVKLGAYVGFDGDFKVFPDVEILANLLDGKVQIFGGWNGEYRQNNFRSLSKTNPYIVSQLTLENTTIQNMYGGVKGQLSNFSYEFRGGYRPADNLVMWVNDFPADTTRFIPVFGDIDAINLHATVTAEPVKNLKLFISGDYNTYNSDSLQNVFHLPNFEFNAGAQYLMFEKLGLKGELYLADGAKYLDANGNVLNLNTLFDLNFGATYQLMKNFSLFLDVNNVVSSKYRRWNGYPQTGVNFLGGVIIKL
ncbi:MAG: hypothetical protein AAF502_06165 [Bacteroidota bacterium]